MQKKDNLGLEIPDYDLKALTSQSNYTITYFGHCITENKDFNKFITPAPDLDINLLQINMDDWVVSMDYHGWGNKPVFGIHTKECVETNYCAQRDLGNI